jgi:hypothetical protein
MRGLAVSSSDLEDLANAGPPRDQDASCELALGKQRVRDPHGFGEAMPWRCTASDRPSVLDEALGERDEG